MKRDLISSRLDGLAARNQQRAVKRRLMQAEHLERKRMGRAKQYSPSVYVPTRKKA